MKQHQSNTGREPYDLTEESSRHPGSEKATEKARQPEMDDV